MHMFIFVLAVLHVFFQCYNYAFGRCKGKLAMTFCVGLSIKVYLTSSISYGLYSWTSRWQSSNLISESGGIEFKPWSHIPLHIIILTYKKSILWGLRSTYLWRWGIGWHAVGGILNLIKGTLTPSISPKPISWVQSSLGHAFSVVLINSTLTSEKSMWWDSAEYAYGLSTWSRLAHCRGILDRGIKGLVSHFISSGFYSRTSRGDPSNLIPEVMHFLLC
jgi:hypothetical protein